MFEKIICTFQRNTYICPIENKQIFKIMNTVNFQKLNTIINDNFKASMIEGNSIYATIENDFENMPETWDEVFPVAYDELSNEDKQERKEVLMNAVKELLD